MVYGAVPGTPSLSSPGDANEPGDLITDFTPTFRWSAVSGATGYGLYIRDLTSGSLIYDNDSVPKGTSFTLPSGKLTEGHRYRWNMRASNASGWSGFSGYLFFQMAGPEPYLSSVTPSSMPASTSSQTLTLNGSDFVRGATLVFSPPTGSEINSTASKLTFVSSAKITYQLNNGGDGGTWSVRVINPDGQESNSRSFTVTLGPRPAISTVSPASMAASGSTQALTINGSNFVSGATLVFDPPTGLNIPSTASKLAFVSSSKITYQFNDGGDAGIWTVTVVNPDGQLSNPESFSVTSGPAPSISSVDPLVMPALDGNQPLVINGSGFVSSSYLVFDPPTGASIESDAARLAFTATRLTYQFNNAGDAGTWTVQVFNPDGQYSQVKSFVVETPASAAAPVTSSPGTITDASALVSTLSPVFKWSAAANAVRYGLYISRAPYGSANIVYQKTNVPAGTSFTLPISLEADTKYRWQMTSFNAAGVESPAPSDLRYFKTPATSLGAPSLAGPGTSAESGFIVDTLTPQLTWTTVSGAERYGLYLSKYPYGVSNIVYSSTGLQGASHTLPSGKLAASTRYRWNMTAFNVDGVESAVSDHLYFQTQGVPGSPVLSHEAPVYVDGKGPSVRLNWTKSVGSTSFELFRNGSSLGDQGDAASFTDNSGLTAGATCKYYVLAKGPGGSAKSNEVQVLLPGPSLSRANLVPGNILFSPSTVAAGQAIQVQFTISNAGNARSGACKARLRLSKDKVLTSSDIGLQPLDVAIPEITAGQDFSLPKTFFAVPAGLAPGSYYVGVFADSEFQVDQPILDDGALSTATLTVSALQSIDADLTVQNVTFSPSQGPAGSLIKVSALLFNDGADLVEGVAARAYLSTDQTINEADTLLSQTVPVGKMGGKGTFPLEINATLPASVKTGSYYIGIMADVNKKVASKTNRENVASAGTYVLTAAPAAAVSVTKLLPLNPVADGQSHIMTLEGRNFSSSTVLELVESRNPAIVYTKSPEDILQVQPEFIKFRANFGVDAGEWTLLVSSPGHKTVTMPFSVIMPPLAAGSLDIRWLTEEEEDGYSDDTFTADVVHLGSDYPAPAGTPVLSPVTGRIEKISSYASYGSHFVVIKTKVPANRKFLCEDGSEQAATDGYLRIYFGHLMSGPAGNTRSSLTEGSEVIAGQTVIGYIAPPSLNGGWVGEHLHVGALRGPPKPFKFKTAIPGGSDGSTEYPGLWRQVDVAGKDTLGSVRAYLVNPSQINWSELSEQQVVTIVNEDQFKNPEPSLISAKIDELSVTYKVPAVVIKALVEIESDWLQFKPGKLNERKELNKDGSLKGISYGLTQFLVYAAELNKVRFTRSLCARPIENQPQGENDHALAYETVEIDLNSLRYDWAYNLEMGVRYLLSKRIETWGSPIQPEAVDAPEILENWYYPLAYYNGAAAGGVNDPRMSFARTIPAPPSYGRGHFPYQEKIFNAIAQLYELTPEKSAFFGPPIKALLPGPSAVSEAGGRFDYVLEEFGFYDWCKFNRDGTVVTGPSGGAKSIVSGRPGHVIDFGKPGAGHTEVFGRTLDQSGNPVVGAKVTMSSQSPASAAATRLIKSTGVAITSSPTTSGQSVGRRGASNKFGQFRFSDVPSSSLVVLSQVESVGLGSGVSREVDVSADKEITLELPRPFYKPAIESHPSASVRRLGEPAVFSVRYSGSGPITVQWRHNGVPIPGADKDDLHIDSADGSHAGNYHAVVTNTYGEVSSRPASLTLVDQAASALRLKSFTASAFEHQAAASLHLTRTGSPVGRVRCTFLTQDGTARKWLDFQPVEGSVVFETGQKEALIRIPLVDDTITEPPESFTVKLAGPGLAATATIRIEDNEAFPYLDWQGDFIGFVEGSADVSGIVRLNIAGTGSFTGSLQSASAILAFKGVLDANGRATVAVGSSGRSLRIQIGPGPGFGTPSLTLLGVDGIEIAAGGVSRSVSAPGDMNAVSGRYTFRLMRLAGSGVPAGDGFGTAVVDAKGRVSAAVRLPDSVFVTQSTPLLPGGEWPCLLKPYGTAGGVFGRLRFLSASSTSDLEGTLKWVKPTQSAMAFFPAGFVAEVAVVGSRYVAPVAARPWWPGLPSSPANAELSWLHPTADDLPAPLMLNLGSSAVVSVPGKATLTLNRATGGVTSSAVLANRQTLSGSGVVLQKQGYGVGQFTRASQTGSWELRDPSLPAGVLVSAVANPAEGGTVTGAGTFVPGQTVSLLASPSADFEFLGWIEGGTAVSNTPLYQFPATSSRSLTASFQALSQSSFQDSFNRADNLMIENGWLNSSAVSGSGWLDANILNGTLRIVNNRAENSQTSGVAGIHRPFNHSQGIRVEATFTHKNGAGSLRYRHMHAIGIRSSGVIGEGYAVVFTRSDESFNNSQFILLDGTTVVAQQNVTFQFRDSIRAEVDFKADGSIHVHAFDLEAPTTNYNFDFPARAVSASGGQVILVTEGCSGSLRSSIDDVSISQF